MFVSKIKSILDYFVLKFTLMRDHVHIAKGSKISSKVTIGRYTRINAASHIGPCTIGAFCAIGGRLIVRSSNHDMNYLNMQDYFQNTVLRSALKVAGKKKAETEIGNAVWIGDSVIVLSGVKLHKLSEMTHILILILVEIIAEGAALTKLREVVIERLLRNPNFLSGIFEAHSDKLMVLIHVPVIKLAPLRNLFDDVFDGALLGPLGLFVDLSAACHGC